MSAPHQFGPANLYRTIRNTTYGCMLISSCVVLGLAGNFANEFLPNFHRPYIVYALIVPSVTLLSLLVIFLRSQPRWDMLVLFILWVLWLALAAWSQDVIGFVECFSLGGQQTPDKLGNTSLRQYCYEMKTIEAFSWGSFGILTISFLLLLALIAHNALRGNFSGGQFGGGYYGGVQPVYGGYPGGYGGAYGGQAPYVVQQVPGHSVVIQPNANAPPTISQFQGAVSPG